MLSNDILQANGLRHLGGYENLLACAIDELEATLREHDGKGNARETATRTKVENLRAWLEACELGNGQRVQHMVLIEVVDVLA